MGLAVCAVIFGVQAKSGLYEFNCQQYAHSEEAGQRHSLPLGMRESNALTVLALLLCLVKLAGCILILAEQLSEVRRQNA